MVVLDLLHDNKSYSLEKLSEKKYCNFLGFVGAVFVLPTYKRPQTTHSTYFSSQSLALISELASIGTCSLMTGSTKRSVIPPQLWFQQGDAKS